MHFAEIAPPSAQLSIKPSASGSELRGRRRPSHDIRDRAWSTGEHWKSRRGDSCSPEASPAARWLRDAGAREPLGRTGAEVVALDLLDENALVKPRSRALE